jgi:hypothetical protein
VITLTRAHYEKLDEFLGYGRLEAPLWFIGREERTRKSTPEVIQHDLNVRQQFLPVMDLQKAHRMFETGFDLRTAGTPTWLWAARFARAILANARDWQDTQAAKTYIATQLGREKGSTFLTDLFAVPVPSGSGEWPYDGMWASRKDYEAFVRTARNERLIHLVEKYQPKLVLAYGADNKRALEPNLRKLETLTGYPRVRMGYLGSSFVVLTPFFGGRFHALTKDEATQIIATVRTRLR